MDGAYGRHSPSAFQPVRCSTGAGLSVFQCHPAIVLLIRAILSSDSQSPCWSPKILDLCSNSPRRFRDGSLSLEYYLEMWFVSPLTLARQSARKRSESKAE